MTDRTSPAQEQIERHLWLALTNNVGLGCIKRVAADGTLLQMNPTGLSLLEAGTEDEVVGRCVFDLVAPEHRAAFIDLHRDVLAGRPRTLQFEMEGLKGRRCWMETYAVPFSNPASGETEHLAVTHDITERKRMEDALRASEERLRMTLDIAVDGCWQWDLITHQASYSARWLALLGLEHHEIPLNNIMDWRSRIHPDDRPAVEQTLTEHLTGRSPELAFEHRVRHRSGLWKWFAVRGRVTRRDHTGRPVEMMGTMVDITEQRQAEATRLRLQQAIDRARDGMALVGPNGCFTYTNPACAAMFGYEADALLNTDWKRLFPPEWATLLDTVCLPALDQTGHWQGEFVGMRRNGEAFHVELSMSRLPSETEDGRTVLCVCQDITERKQMEQELIRAKEQAESGARAKSDFLATMSHEIRTPMNGVIGMTDLLLDTELTTEQRDYANTLRAAAESLLTILNDILDFSKIEAGKLALERIPFDLRVTIEDTLELMAGAAQKKGLELVGLVDAAVPTFVVGDPSRLRQILINLIGNAIKFTERGEVLVQAMLIEDDTASMLLRLEVIDTGIGLTEEAKAKLFTAFTQADSSTSRKYGGTGLGLSICKRLTELMGGAIGLNSIPGAGTQVWFTVRLGKADAEPPSLASGVDNLRGLRLCIVDDNATSRTLLQYHATAWGMVYGNAEDGPTALSLLRAAAAEGKPFDLAVIDMHMPGMDGLRLGQAIKADPILAQTRLVLLTSLGRRGDARLAQSAGFSGYLTKPVRKAHLYECLRLVMGQPVSRPEGDLTATPASPPLVTRHHVAEARSARRLLVVDDNPINQKVAVRMLEKLGHRVDVAGNGKEALAALARRAYAIVLMDCQMPEMDGFETTRRIREIERRQASTVNGRSTGGNPSPTDDRPPMTAARIPIIAMTANAMDGDRQQCLACGMDDFISKPVKREDLERVLDKWLTPSTEPSRC